jgi:AcrR family transcriptional regulator
VAAGSHKEMRKANPRGRPPGDARKAPFHRAEELAAVALDLFAARNFAAVTIKDIANASGVNTALIYYYFDNKEDLFRAAIEFAVDQAFKNFRLLQARHDNPADIIADWLKNHVELYAPIHKFVKISLDYAGSETSIPVIDRQIRQFYDEERRILSQRIGQGIQQGLFQEVDPDAIAVFISTYLDGLMVRSVILDDFDLKHSVDLLRRELWQRLGYSAEDTAVGEVAAAAPGH